MREDGRDQRGTAIESVSRENGRCEAVWCIRSGEDAGRWRIRGRVVQRRGR